MQLRSDFSSFYIVFPLRNYSCCVLTTFVLPVEHHRSVDLGVAITASLILCSPSSPSVLRFVLPYAACSSASLHFDLEVPFSSSAKTGWWHSFPFIPRKSYYLRVFIFKRRIVFTHVRVCLHICLYSTLMSGVCRDKMRAPDTPELKLQAVVS